MTTIRDIARDAGVSIATVSRAFNASPDVRPETRKRILALAEAMNYRPHRSARNLRRSAEAGRELSYTVGFLAFSERLFATDPFSVELTAAVEEALRQRGYGLRIVRCGKGGGIPPEIERGEVDGVFCRGGEPMLRAIGGRVPVVTLDHYNPALEVYGLLPDYRSGVYEATRRLLAAGARRIAASCSEVARPQAMDFDAQIGNGCRQAMREAGVAAANLLPIGGIGTPQGGYEAGRRLFGAGDARPDAILASDQAMPGIMRAAWERGLRIPDDVSLVGVDGIPAGEYYAPPLTTVDVRLAAIGARTAALLVESAAAGERRRGMELMPSALVIRASARLGGAE